MNWQAISPIEEFLPKEIIYGKVLIIDARDSFTHNLVQVFLSLGAQVLVLDAFINKSENIKKINFDYLVLSPGPRTPKQSGIMKAACKYYYKKKPILGICLGMQVINEVFGGKTVKLKNIVHGKTSKINHNGQGVFTNINTPTEVARYHSLQVTNINKIFNIQATLGELIMAFNQPKVLSSVQFHPESFMSKDGRQMIKNFLQGEF